MRILLYVLTFFMLCNDQIDKRAYTGIVIIVFPFIQFFAFFTFSSSTVLIPTMYCWTYVQGCV